MQFDDIHPFVRYVHYLPLDKHACYHSTIPYDCRLFFCYDGEGAICVKDNLYEMQPGHALNIPSPQYFQTIRDGYEMFDFPLELLEKALMKSVMPIYEKSEETSELDLKL